MERSVSRDLRLVAADRLANTARATETLMALELESIQNKYANFAREPRFKALVEARDIPTMEYFAQELFVDTNAIAVAFMDVNGTQLAKAGDFVGLQQLTFKDDVSVVSLFDQVLITTSRVSLVGRQGPLGFFIAQQVVSQRTIDEWSALLGAQLVIGDGRAPREHLSQTPDDLPMITVYTSTAAEKAALRKARYMALFALLVAMAASIGMSYYLARGFTKAIHRIQVALKAFGEGTFKVQLPLGRRDEVGDIYRSTMQLADRLERWRSQLVELDTVNALNHDLNQKTQQLVTQKQQIESRQVLLQQSMLDLQQANNRMSLYKQCLESSQESIVITDHAGIITYVNPFCIAQNLYPKSALLGKMYDLFFLEEDREELCGAIERVLSVSPCWQAEVSFQKASGASYPVDVTITLVRHDSEQSRSFIMVFRDISIRAEFEAKLIRVANHDELTGLLNRRCFEQQIQTAIHLHQPTEHKFAILWLDLDRFKHVNDTYGHHIGDELLIGVTKAMRAALRAQDQVARMGGDEFAFLLMYSNHKAGKDIATKLLGKIRDFSMDVDGERVDVGGSFGLAMYPEDGETVKELLKVADLAMYQAKRRGRDQVCVFHSRM